MIRPTGSVSSDQGSVSTLSDEAAEFAPPSEAKEAPRTLAIIGRGADAAIRAELEAGRSLNAGGAPGSHFLLQ
jgi:hypothetical protein